MSHFFNSLVMLQWVSMKSLSTLADHLIRLEKYMAQQGLASRREAKQLIMDGYVFVNAVIITEPGFGVDPHHDRVTLKNNLPDKKTVAVYKPRGVETSKTHPDNNDIHDLFPELADLAPIGRLDKDSEGLILLSNDGVIARIITGQHSDIEKEYIVTVREIVTDESIHLMSQGIMLDNKITLPAVVKKINDHTFSIILQEGRKHQIRRMADACHLTIENLKRIRIGEITLKDLKLGEYRILLGQEIMNFRK